MFYDVEKFPFLSRFIDNYLDIKNELFHSLSDVQARKLIEETDTPDFLETYTSFWVKENGFNEDQIGYDIRQGEYHTLPIFKKDYPVVSFDVNTYFPKTMEMLNHVPNLYFSAFFKMSGKSTLKPHTHNRRHLIFHLLMNDLEEGICEVTVDGNTTVLKQEGDHLLFDYSYEHSTVNHAVNPRYNFVVDFNPF